MDRRDSLKALGVLATTGSALLRSPIASAASLSYAPEKGAQLKVLRWKRFVQGDEDAWLSNSRRFTDQTGVSVQIESVGSDELRPKGAMVASLGAGPDIILGYSDMPRLYPDKCVDLTELSTYLGQKYGGWYDISREYGMHRGRWFALPTGAVGVVMVYRASSVRY